MASAQTLLPGPYAPQVQAAMDRLRAERYLERFWDKDASLWTTDPAAQAHIRNRLGWLSIPRVMAKETEALRRFAREIRDAGFTHTLLLGMGGSGLFSEVCRNTFGAATGHPDLTVLDTTDPTAIKAGQAKAPLTHLFIIVSSKSGMTSEITASSAYFYETFKAAGEDPGAHAIAITDAGTPLEAQAAAWKLRRAFVHGPQNGADVGGRFSALTYFGLVPVALLGIDVDVLLSRAIEMLDQCGPTVALDKNPAALLGAVLGALAGVGRDKMTLLCPPALASFGTWVEQLIAESTGKSGKGIAPLFGEPPREPSAYRDDRIFVELQLTSQFDQALDRRVRALAQAGHPVVRIHWQDRYDLGGEVIRWFFSTPITASLMGINPFDEPNVEESKDRTKALLADYARAQRFPDERPLWSSDEAAVYGALKSGSTLSPFDSPRVSGGLAQGDPERSRGTLADCLSSWLQQGRREEYIAILSFLPRTPALDQAVHGIRRRFAESLGAATMVGFGPRYLHSTGQLYKGGPDAALFLLLTADEAQDLPIPGQPYTFGVLKQAQALGDFQAMQQRGRRLLRIHLRGNLDRAVQQLISAVSDAGSAQVRKE